MASLGHWCTLAVLLFGLATLCAASPRAEPVCAEDHEVPLLPNISQNDIEEARKLAKAWRSANPDFDVSTLPPLILFPGLSGSGLNFTLSDAKSPFSCPKDQDWLQLWLNPDEVLRLNCFLFDMNLNYDPVESVFHNNEGVTIEAKDFGGVKGVDYYGYDNKGNPVNGTAYMQALIVYLEGIGYVVGENLGAAPYDWRQAENPNGSWNDDVKELIEDMYTRNGDSPVWTIAHSMGNLELTNMLNNQDQEWRDKYFGTFLSVAAPWSGASVALHSVVSGVPILFLPPDYLKDLIQSFGSVVWMLPDAYLGDQPLIVVNETTEYNYYDLAKLFVDINATDTLEIYKHLAGKLSNAPSPNVPIHCIYGINKDTELWYEYSDGLFEPATAIHCGNGDGVVPIQSLEKCQSFDPIATKTFDLVNHMEIMKDPLFFNYIGALLTGGDGSGA